MDAKSTTPSNAPDPLARNEQAEIRRRRRNRWAALLAAVGAVVLLVFVSGTSLLRHHQRVFVFETLFGLLVGYLIAKLRAWLLGDKRDLPALSWPTEQEEKRD